MTPMGSVSYTHLIAERNINAFTIVCLQTGFPYIHKIIVVAVGRPFRESELVFHASPLCHINRCV